MKFFDKPKHKNKAPGWKYNLPGPYDSPTTEPYTPVLSYPPNFIDNVCMELPTGSSKGRGIGAWLTVTMIPIVVCQAIWLVWVLIKGNLFTIPFVSILGVFFVMAPWTIICFWRLDVEAPVDEPIRFNRARRKVYVYHFRHNWRRPLSKTEWGVYPKAYDWENLRAEFCSLYAPSGGGFLRFVTLAVLDPDNGQVLDRFPFMDGREQGEMYWAMAQLFMQQGPAAVPTFEQPPRDWNGETHFENIALRLAPKVKWPEQMDLESRTAP